MKRPICPSSCRGRPGTSPDAGGRVAARQRRLGRRARGHRPWSEGRRSSGQGSLGGGSWLSPIDSYSLVGSANVCLNGHSVPGHGNNAVDVDTPPARVVPAVRGGAGGVRGGAGGVSGAELGGVWDGAGSLGCPGQG